LVFVDVVLEDLEQFRLLSFFARYFFLLLKQCVPVLFDRSERLGKGLVQELDVIGVLRRLESRVECQVSQQERFKSLIFTNVFEVLFA